MFLQNQYWSKVHGKIGCIRTKTWVQTHGGLLESSVSLSQFNPEIKMFQVAQVFNYHGRERAFTWSLGHGKAKFQMWQSSILMSVTSWTGHELDLPRIASCLAPWEPWPEPAWSSLNPDLGFIKKTGSLFQPPLIKRPFFQRVFCKH